jgi:hypothetical protein
VALRTVDDFDFSDVRQLPGVRQKQAIDGSFYGFSRTIRNQQLRILALDHFRHRQVHGLLWQQRLPESGRLCGHPE